MAKGTKRLTSLQTQRLSAGHTVSTLAKKANVSDRTIINLENGGNELGYVVQRIADALGVSLGTLGAVDL